MGGFFKSIAPIASAFIPGLGPVASAALGAGVGALSGGGLKGALLGGLSGGMSGGLSNSLVNSLAPGLSKGLTSGLSGALTGAVGGLASGGGLKGALMGGALGGGGGYLMNGGDIPGLGKMGNTINWNDGTTGTYGGTGVIGKLTNSTAQNGGSLYSKAAPVVSGALDYFAQDKAAEQLEEQQQRAMGMITPLMKESFTPGDLENNPGYQFSLNQGQKAIDRASSARGNYFSGQAATDASQFAQGLASQTYNDAYSQWLSDRGQRLGAAGAAAGIAQGIGETQATSTLNKGQTLSQSLSALLGQLNGGTNVYNPKTGTYYDPRAVNQGIDLSEILKTMGYA